MKPEVTFETVARIEDSPNGRRYFLTGIKGHPRLRDGSTVRTGPVTDVVKDENNQVVEVETENTVYRKV